MRMSKRQNLARRAEIGAERRARSRLQILRGAIELFGSETGGAVRLQDICKTSGVSHGTFYNHFTSVYEFAQTLSEELSREFDQSVNVILPGLATSAERSAAATRYYLHATRATPVWGWAMVNAAKGPMIFGPKVFANSLREIQMGIDREEFSLKNAKMGRDILLGTLFTGMLRLLSGDAEQDYPENLVCRILQSFGMDHDQAWDVSTRPLPVLPASDESDQVIITMPRLDISAP